MGLEAWSHLQESIITYGVGALGLKTHLNRVNTLSSPSTSSTLGTLVTQTSAFGHFKLSEGQALVITLQSGGAGYFVVAAQDPGVHNWLDTEGRHEGTIMVRWQDLPAQPVAGGPQVSVKVVALADLRAVLPAGARWVDAATRAVQLAAREAGYERRTSVGF